MYKIIDKTGKPLLMKDGTPFVYTVLFTAELALKFLRPKTKRSLRPLKIVPA